MSLEFRTLRADFEVVEIASINCEAHLTLRLDARKIKAKVIFEAPTGFRVLDERDLCDFWAAGISSKVGWLFEIMAGGWLDSEKKRKGFISAEIASQREFLAIGIDWCVSVISADEPIVEWSVVA